MNNTDLTRIPARASLEQYKKQAKDFVKLANSGDSKVLQRVKKWHPRSDQLRLPSADLVLADAQLALAREHGFESWPKFAKHIGGLARKSSTISKFELAADAVITGDSEKIESLLRDNPELIQAHSTRLHRSTLLHYLGANGLEDYRQKSPKNAVAIARILLDGGAEVDALADIYGKSATLELVATSIHPKRARVQIGLMTTLLEYGSAIDGIGGHGSPLLAALRNGRAEAAEFLAKRGARLDFEGAAGVGRLDVVERLFHGGSAAKAQMESGFLWACEYGRNSVVDFLLKQGMDLRAQAHTGLTGLHWAVVGGQVETIKLLLEHGAPLEAKNVYGGTALGQALWCATNGDPAINYVPVIEMLTRAALARGENADC